MRHDRTGTVAEARPSPVLPWSFPVVTDIKNHPQVVFLIEVLIPVHMVANQEYLLQKLNFTWVNGMNLSIICLDDRLFWGSHLP
ncbi:hypothetical protein J4733_05980 [Klebsiella pneumoniae]|uniref:Uncharacterized protein n=1 Tax=Klebsiella pneumoniae TaxID=573 RepID=A0A939NTM5_KLEPN|nr:hypothetical protein [Klebsiella pneumoniae]